MPSVGVSPLSWANDVLPELGAGVTVERILDEAKAAGYVGIEKGSRLPTDPEGLEALLRPRGMRLSSGWHSGSLAEGTVEAEIESCEAHAFLLAAMGCRVMVYGECAATAGEVAPWDEPMGSRIPLEDIDAHSYAQRLTEFAGELMDRHGLAVAYHPHLMTVTEGPDEVDLLFSNLGREVGMVLDTGHCTAGEGDVASLLANWGDRVNHVHLKDVRLEVLAKVRDNDESFNSGVRQGMFTVPGDGNVDFGPVAEWLDASGYDGWLVVEAEQDPDVHPPVPMVTQARKFVREAFGL